MNEHERLELEAHVEELERAALSLGEVALNGRYSHERTHASGAACAYEITAVWLRGFLRRHAEEKEQADDHDAASVKARWSG